MTDGLFGDNTRDFNPDNRGGFDRPSEAASAGSNQVAAPVERVVRESERVAEDIQDFLVTGSAEWANSEDVEKCSKEIAAYIIARDAAQYASNVKVGVASGRSEAAVMLETVLADSKGIRQVIYRGRFVKAVPVAEINKVVKALKEDR